MAAREAREEATPTPTHTAAVERAARAVVREEREAATPIHTAAVERAARVAVREARVAILHQ